VLTTVAVAGAALGASVAAPFTAAAAPAAPAPAAAPVDGTALAVPHDTTHPVRHDSDTRNADDHRSGERVSGRHASGRPAASPAVAHRAKHVTRASDRTRSHRPGHVAAKRTAALRPPTSGEEQYRNGCEQGYITDGCQQFAIPNLVQRGIDPNL
jgi:hypothetical protein